MFVGIDVSKLKFDVCCLFDGKKRTRVFKNNNEGFMALLEWIKDLKSTDIPVFCMEATGCYHELLAEHLHNCGNKVCVINPLLIKRFRESQMIRTKTDKSDSFAIAEFCLKNNPAPWKPKAPETKELRDLNKYINDLKEELNRWQNRLEKRYYNKKVEQDINNRVNQLTEEIKKLTIDAQAMINTSKVFSEKAMRLCEIVGVGPKLTLAILSEMPDVSCFENAEQYAAFAGVTPCQFQSGTSVRRRPSMSRLGSRSIRKTLFTSALVVKNYNRYFANWIAKLEKKGKKPKVIIVAVMRKLLHIIYGMLKNNARFNPELAFAVIKNKQ